MKKLNVESLDVQVLNIGEMQEKVGGCGWCNFRDKFLVRPLEFVAEKVVAKYVGILLDKVIKV